MNLDTVRSAYAAACNRWTGCDWPVEFGPLRLPLHGLKSTHARMLARATAGEESTAWHRAADWLAEVERDARAAQHHAKSSVEAAERGDWGEALRLADDACRLEATHRELTVWGPLRSLLEEGGPHAKASRATGYPN